MADEAKRLDRATADQLAAKDVEKKWTPQWGRAVNAFQLSSDRHWRAGGTGDLLNSGALNRDGVTAMELHPLGVLVTVGKGEAAKQQVVAGASDIRLA